MHESENYAPIILFVYNRLDHTMQTVEALKKNTLAAASELFVYSDAPKKASAAPSVNEVRTYLHSLEDGFKKITIIERESNFGLAASIIGGASHIIAQYGKAIVLEDDLVTSPTFLCYMNAALDHYENRKNIFAISGYSGTLPSLSRYPYDTYLAYRPASWGWATWKDRWEGIDWEVGDWQEFIANRKKRTMFNRGGIDMTRMLKHYMQGKNNSWAIRWSYEMYKRDHYCVYPRISKVQNIGFGENATHCSGINIYKTLLDTDGNCTFNFTDAAAPEEAIARDFRYQFSYTNKLIKKTAGYIKKAFS